jgi:hypothetical protein
MVEALRLYSKWISRKIHIALLSKLMVGKHVAPESARVIACAVRRNGRFSCHPHSINPLSPEGKRARAIAHPRSQAASAATKPE